jgi:hypothetical protein
MKVSKAEGYISDDGTIFKTEIEAIEDNIYSVLRSIEDETSTTIESDLELIHWFKDNKDKLNYILNNIDKVNLLTES